MRRLLSVGVAAAALMGVSAIHAGAAHAGIGRVKLTLVTLPRISGVRFSLDGSTIVTGKTGTARIETTPGSHLLSVLDTTVSSAGVRSHFKRWGEGKDKFEATRTLDIDHNTTLVVGFEQWVKVHFGFTDRAGRSIVGQVAKVTLSSGLGNRVWFQPSFPQWLQATTLARRYNGLASTQIQYSIDQALVQGANVVNQGQNRFYPADTRQVMTRVLLYSARISVRDFIFGTATGSSVDLVYPDGTPTTHPLRGRTLVLSSLPRGTYQVKVHAGGYVPVVSLALSRNQVLQVKVVSYLDMLLFLVLGLAVLTALVLIPRPFLRLRLRSLGTGRRPTPDDLEPAKPLSGERRQLVFRYMVPRPAAATPSVARPQRQAGRPLVATTTDATDTAPRRRGWRVRDAAAERFHHLQAMLQRPLQLRTRASGSVPAPREVLSGERLELIHVYMGEAAPERETGAPPRPALQPADASSTPERRASGRRRALLALFRQHPAGSGAPVAPKTPATPLSALAETAAAAERSIVPALQPELEPSETGSRQPGEPGPAPTAPSRAEPAEAETAAKPAQRRAPARRRTPATKKTAATKAKGKTRTSTTRTASGSSKPKAKTTRPKKPVVPDALPASNGGTDDLSLLRPDLAAAVETLQEDLRKARKSASPAPRKRTASAKATAAAKPKRTRPSAQQKTDTTKKAAAATASHTTTATAEPKTKTTTAKKPTSAAATRSSNGETQDLSLLRPDLAAAVEALQEDLRNARTSTERKSRRKTGTKATR
jgi:hypothetical protein